MPLEIPFLRCAWAEAVPQNVIQCHFVCGDKDRKLAFHVVLARLVGYVSNMGR